MDFGFLNVQEFLKKAENRECLVVGDIILDKYIDGEVARISPEAPIPVVKVVNERYVLGGAANVAGNVCGFHIKVYLCGLLGNDEHAAKVLKLLAEKQIEFLGLHSSERCTTVKTRVIGKNQQLLRIDQEDMISISKQEENSLLEKLSRVLLKVQTVVLSDYNKGICSDSFCRRLMDICRQTGKRVIVDPKSNNWKKYMGAYLVTPNFKEFQEVVGYPLHDTETEIKRQANFIMERYKLRKILITRSQKGMVLVKKDDRLLNFQSAQQEVFDVSGAGDTVIATIAAYLSAGTELEKALKAANYAAGLAVSKMGTYTVTLEEVVEYVNHLGLYFENKVLDLEKIRTMLHIWRKKNEKVVFTNGCFDILHMGHIEYLNKARRLGNKLIVGLNTDASVKRLKGSSRPVNNQDARALTLAALQCVDAVVLFEEDTPENLIRLIKPDYLVKGSDYKPSEIVGREYAGEVCTIPFTEGYSTTKLIEKVQHDHGRRTMSGSF